MTLDTPSLKRLQELESQLEQMNQERDRLKQRIENEQIEAAYGVQPLLEKINDRLKTHGCSISIDKDLSVFIRRQPEESGRCLAVLLKPEKMKQALQIIERSLEFIASVESTFELYRNVSDFDIDFTSKSVIFEIHSDSYTIYFTYDAVSETVSAFAKAHDKRMLKSFTIGNVTMIVETSNHSFVNYTLTTQTYVESLRRIQDLYDRVKSDMVSALSKLSF